ncbi:MAG: hypothetical protein LUD48_02040, partial [Prevotella sp.]|nr:hypothetical protein [Prevotella sp.]
SYSIGSEDLKKHRNLTLEYLKKNKNEFPNSKIRKELINALENDNNFFITFLYMRYNERNFFGEYTDIPDN